MFAPGEMLLFSGWRCTPIRQPREEPTDVSSIQRVVTAVSHSAGYVCRPSHSFPKWKQGNRSAWKSLRTVGWRVQGAYSAMTGQHVRRSTVANPPTPRALKKHSITYYTAQTLNAFVCWDWTSDLPSLSSQVGSRGATTPVLPPPAAAAAAETAKRRRENGIGHAPGLFTKTRFQFAPVCGPLFASR